MDDSQLSPQKYKNRLKKSYITAQFNNKKPTFTVQMAHGRQKLSVILKTNVELDETPKFLRIYVKKLSHKSGRHVEISDQWMTLFDPIFHFAFLPPKFAEFRRQQRTN